MRFLGVKELGSLAVRIYTKDQPGIAGCQIQIARPVENHRPDVFAFRVEEKLWLTGCINAVHLRIGQRSCIEPIVRVDSQGVNLEAANLRENSGFTAGR